MSHMAWAALGPSSQRCLTISLDQSSQLIKPRKTQRSKPPSPQQGTQKSRQKPPGNAPTERAARQVAFPSPLPPRPRIAIIGGGLAGLACATQLANLNIRTCVFDTGEHGVGGRLGTRSSADGSLHSPEPLPQDTELIFDHAAQFFTATDPGFQKMVSNWEAAGLVCRWDGPVVGDLYPGGVYKPWKESSLETGNIRYIAPAGMRSLAEHLAAAAAPAAAEGSDKNKSPLVENLIEVRRPMWVNAARAEAGGWRVSARGKDQGMFDAVVIAHNGKCANRLSSGMGVPAVYKQLRRLKLSANWVLMVAFEEKINVPGTMQGAFVRDNHVLSWVGNNTAKFAARGSKKSGEENKSSSSASVQKNVECWTLISTQKYGKENKVPQEAVPLDVAASIAENLLSAFADALGVSRASLPRIVYQKAQLWGAALPLNTPNDVLCIWDAKGRVGVAGDWVAGGGSMQAAAVSGIALAEVIAHQAAAGKNIGHKEFNCGLDTPFVPVNDEQIGQFPSSVST